MKRPKDPRYSAPQSLINLLPIPEPRECSQHVTIEIRTELTVHTRWRIKIGILGRLAALVGYSNIIKDIVMIYPPAQDESFKIVPEIIPFLQSIDNQINEWICQS